MNLAHRYWNQGSLEITSDDTSLAMGTRHAINVMIHSHGAGVKCRLSYGHPLCGET